MLKAYRRLFYQEYLWNQKYWGKNDKPIFALFPMSLAVFFNIFSLLIFIKLIFHYPIIDTLKITKSSAILYGVTLFAINYYFLIAGDRYKNILAEFSDESLQWRMWIGRITLAYEIGTYLVFFLSLFSLRL